MVEYNDVNYPLDVLPAKIVKKLAVFGLRCVLKNAVVGYPPEQRMAVMKRRYNELKDGTWQSK